LAIIDVSDQGSQPMVSANGRYVLVFNGEIYNHRSMGDRLAGDGAVLRGHSDTEVLLETIARRGLDATLDDANGMFALALWDRASRTLTLARDRLGEKPLYYGRAGDDLVFASELTALQRHPGAEFGIDHGALALFLRHGFVPSPYSILEGVKKLPPGHTLTVGGGAATDAGSPRPFWTLREAVRRGRQDPLAEEDEPETLERAELLLRESVGMRMVSDVPLGAFLSGGVDSSLVVALMQEQTDRPVRTFTVSVGGAHDEQVHARAIAAHLGTDHTEIELADSSPIDLASSVASIFDEPFGDPSGIPTALMCRAARDHVTVCLSGDGGDEILAGYNRHRVADPTFSRLWRAPRGLRGVAAAALDAAPPQSWQDCGGRIPVVRRIPDVGTKVQKLASILSADRPYAAYRMLATNIDPAMIMRDAFEPPTPATEYAGWPSGLDPLESMLFVDQAMTLPDDMLVKVDRASMVSSLECRVPLLDHRFVELSWRLPENAKVRNGRGKWLLRQLLARHVPPTLFNRPKQGFDPPIAEWLRGPLRDWAGDLLAPASLRREGLLDPAGVQTLLSEHLTGRRNHEYALWSLLMLQSWREAACAKASDG
jgi:asparagine synthase (glutamine-hydrolysing)